MQFVQFGYNASSIRDLTISVHAFAILARLYPPPPNAIILPSECSCESLCNTFDANLCALELYCKCVNGSPLTQSAPHWKMINSGFETLLINSSILLNSLKKSLSSEFGFI